MKVKLNKKVLHKDKELTELDLNLDELTGLDLLDCEQAVIKSGRQSLLNDFSKAYLIQVAARACKMPAELLESLGAKDFTNITNLTQNFLFN